MNLASRLVDRLSHRGEQAVDPFGDDEHDDSGRLRSLDDKRLALIPRSEPLGNAKVIMAAGDCMMEISHG